jgi:hypothetical protein
MYRPPIIQIKKWNNTITSLSLSLLPFSRLGMAAALEDNDISLSQNYPTTMEGIQE